MIRVYYRERSDSNFDKSILDWIDVHREIREEIQEFESDPEKLAEAEELGRDFIGSPDTQSHMERMKIMEQHNLDLGELIIQQANRNLDQTWKSKLTSQEKRFNKVDN